jgi:pimeloyl-ACP methyl ester carboxylesterase
VPKVRVGGTQLYYERRGSGEPLLLITGFGLSAAIFDPVSHLYTQRFDCVLYDNRGAGRSGAPLRPTSIPELAADAAGLIERLGLGSAHVYGVSMGGMVAQELAILFPERVRALVLGCTFPGGPRAIRPALTELGTLARAMLGGLRRPGRPWLAGALFSPSFRREYPERVLELLEGFRAHRPLPHGPGYHFLASIYHDTVSRLGEIQAPTLVVHGGGDEMAPLANARLMADRIPDAELCVIPGAGHAYALEQPEESFRALVDWLEEHSPVAPGRPGARSWQRSPAATRALGLPIGAMRTGRSLAIYAAERLQGRHPPRHEPVERTPASGSAGARGSAAGAD